MQFGTNKVTECHLMSLVLISYNQQMNIFNVQTCEVGVMIHVTSCYRDYCSYCISQGAKLLMLETFCILLSITA